MKALFLTVSIGFVSSVGFSQASDTTQNKSNKEGINTYSPAISLENHVGGGQFGEVTLGLSYQNKTRISSKDDASAAVYVGLGEPEKLIGAGININIFGLTNNFGELNNVMEGGLDFHINKFFLDKKLLIDLGVDNAVVWGGNSYISYQKSWYSALNYLIFFKEKDGPAPFSYLSFTGGIGNGNFRKDNTYTENHSGSFEPFFSIATPVFKNINIILEWNGYDIAGGASLTPSQKIPLTFMCEITDITYGNPRMIASLSYPLNLKKASSRQKNNNRPLNVKNIRPVRTIAVNK